MNKSRQVQWKRLLPKILITFIFISIVIPFIIWQSYHEMKWDEWNSMLLSYLGGAVGGIATLIAIYLTIKHNDENNEETFNLQLELKRVEVIPHLNIESVLKATFSKSFFSNETDKQYDEDYTNRSPSGYFIFENNTLEICLKLDDKYKKELSSGFNISSGKIIANNSFEHILKLTNIGLGPCINVKVDLYKSDDQLIKEYIQMPFNLNVGEEAFFRLVFISYPEEKYYFKFSITDIYGKNFYMQRFNFEYKKNMFICRNIESPNVIENYTEKNF